MISLSVKERLLKYRRIHEETGCWLWTKSINPITGYGQISVNSKQQTVHRVSYKEFVRELTQDVLHKITCFFKHCFNPDHLYEGTQKDNYKDMEPFGKHIGLIRLQEERRNKTHCSQGHEFNEESTYIDSKGYRSCKICRKIRNDNRIRK